MAKFPERLRLLAFDADDLSVVSTFCQDAVVKIENIDFEPAEQRFFMQLNRFAWDGPVERKGLKKLHQRRLSILHIDRVISIRSRGVDRTRGDDVLSLLAIGFERHDADDPSGTVLLTFSGEAEIALKVECLELRLRDLDAAWQASARPRHPA